MERPWQPHVRTRGKRNAAAVVTSKLCCLGSDFSESTGEEHVMKSRMPTFRHAAYCTGLYNHLFFQLSQLWLQLCLHFFVQLAEIIWIDQRIPSGWIHAVTQREDR